MAGSGGAGGGLGVGGAGNSDGRVAAVLPSALSPRQLP